MLLKSIKANLNYKIITLQKEQHTKIGKRTHTSFLFNLHSFSTARRTDWRMCCLQTISNKPTNLILKYTVKEGQNLSSRHDQQAAVFQAGMRSCHLHHSISRKINPTNQKKQIKQDSALLIFTFLAAGITWSIWQIEMPKVLTLFSNCQVSQEKLWASATNPNTLTEAAHCHQSTDEDF